MSDDPQSRTPPPSYVSDDEWAFAAPAPALVRELIEVAFAASGYTGQQPAADAADRGIRFGAASSS